MLFLRRILAVVKSISLIGFSGVGKSTLGVHLAEQLNYIFLDSDQCIEERSQCTVSTLFARKGEEVFRQMESNILKDILSEYRDTPFVLATGGGLPCNPINLELLKAHTTVIYLKATVYPLARRLHLVRSTRPLVAKKSLLEIEAYLEEVLPQRAIYYQQADITINTDIMCTSEDELFIVSQIVKALKGKN